MAAEPAARITRVVLKNYKSIVSCDVELRPLTILVGPNGSGKSNFLDALEYVSDALKFGLYPWSHSNGRGGNLITRGLPDGSSFLIEIHFVLPSKASGFYALEIRVPFPGEYRVKRETCVLADSDHSSEKISYSVREGDEITEWLGLPLTADLAPARAPDRLYLTALSGLPMVRPVYDLLNGISLYHLDLAHMRALVDLSSGDRLAPDGANVASVLRRMQQLAPEPRERVVDYLRHITPGLLDVTTEQMGPYEVVEFVDRRAKDDEYGHWRFSASEISDGTLRALGVLTALFQGRMGGDSQVSLVGIEEPEAGLHPHAAAVLLGALQDASVTTQVVVTTHSADLLYSDDIDIDSLLAVVAEDGVTTIGPVDEFGRSIIRDQLMTAGELLHQNLLRPKTATNGLAGEPAAADLAPKES